MTERPAVDATRPGTRIAAAHHQLLESLRITDDMPNAVVDALIKRSDDVQASGLAFLLGRLSAVADGREPIEADRLAEVVEAALTQAEEFAARIIAKAAQKGAKR